MSTSPLETKLSNLQAEVRVATEKQYWENFPRNSHNDVRSNARPSRPNRLGDMGGNHTPRTRPTNLIVGSYPQPESQNSKENESKLQEIMKLNGLITIDGKRYHTTISQMKDLGELGNGTCGHVVKMLHEPSNTVIAVKQMRRSGNPDENKRIIMDIDVVLKSHGCDYIVKCLGCFITDADVWICMELMATCFDKLLKRFHEPVPEPILGKVTVATVKALHYLKEEHGVMHRDVKPSNILLDEKGRVKLCDFGISGRLVDSKAKTRSAGCAAYMAPERIDPPDPLKPDYDIRADVWSLGITLVELATGEFPYQNCITDFEVLTKVLQDDPPSLPENRGFSIEFRNFVKSCLTKNYKSRPKYRKLLEEPFIKKYEVANVNVADWYAQITKTTNSQSTQTSLPHSSPTAPPAPPAPPAPSVPPPPLNSKQPLRHSPSPSPCASPSPSPSPSPSVRRSNPAHPPHPPQHVRSISETGRPVYPPMHPHHFNGDVITNGRWSPFNPAASYSNVESEATLGGRYSPFHSSRLASAVDVGAAAAASVNAAAVNAMRSSPAHSGWQASTLPHEALNDWNAPISSHRYGASMTNSPHTGRRRFPSEPPPSSSAYREHYHSGNTSPLVLQRYYHQQQQHQQMLQQEQPQHEQLHHHLHHHHHHHHHIHHHHNSYPLPPPHLPLDTVDAKKEDSVSASSSASSSGKKRFASYVKLNVGAGGAGPGGSASNYAASNMAPVGMGGGLGVGVGLPPARPSRHASPSPGPPPPSPDPASCYSRLLAAGDGFVTAAPPPHTLGRRAFPLDVSPIRRDILEGSPSLPQRYMSPTPPQPPPRRLSTEGGPISGPSSGPSSLTLAGTNSVPGSPQIRRMENGRERYHLTPQPQRRGLGGTVDLNNL